ncbi:MAG: hypothetical protein NXI28_08710 [bacterium]|nr:hypothetical protein [bacterium]
MTGFRTLRFELMEPRLSLAANVLDIVAELQAEIAAHGMDPQRLQAIVDDFTSPDTETLANQPETSSPGLNDSSDSPMVRFRVDVRDSQHRPIENLQAGVEYHAKVYVQDLRDLTSENPDHSGFGGVFQAWVDLQFSDNLRPTGSVQLNESFLSNATPEMDGAILRNLGGTSRDLKPHGGAEQLLIDVPFVVLGTELPSRIQVSPSAAQLEPVLLFGIGEVIENQNIAASGVDFPPVFRIDSADEAGSPIGDNASDMVPSTSELFPPVWERVDGNDFSNVGSLEPPAVSFVSFIPAYRDNGFESRFKRRGEVEGEGGHSEDREQFAEPLELSTPFKRGSEASTASGEDGSEEEGKLQERESKYAGLFYDEALFLEGAFLKTFQSEFRLHFRVFSTPWNMQEDFDEPKPAQGSGNFCENFVDIAAILRPSPPAKTWRETVDEVIAGGPFSQVVEEDRNLDDRGSMEELPDDLSTRRKLDELCGNSGDPNLQASIEATQDREHSSKPKPLSAMQSH